MSARAAIVVEGGAMRGVFAAGVLDVFLERDFHPFDLALGVSAGACVLVSHLGGQHGRNLRCFLDQLSRREFIDPRRLVTGGHALDLDWLWDTLMRDDPIDEAAIFARGTELVFATTCAERLVPVFVPATPEHLLPGLKASCAIPGLYRGGVEVGGRLLVDGGISAPLPIEEAYARGAREVLVLRSHRGRSNELRRRIARRLASATLDAPAVARLAATALHAYARALHVLGDPPPGCSVLEVAPPGALRSHVLTQDRASLLADYELGRRAGIDAIAAWGELGRRASGVVPTSGAARSALTRWAWTGTSRGRR